ncbi:S1C family serine protease [Phytohabitans kaempferiae]|uniref:S1C family serine protease n=1 Tax=Phytohabitans kaempferiae TaxID=1620943 RepID=A0ABV6MGV3_9ACTN
MRRWTVGAAAAVVALLLLAVALVRWGPGGGPTAAAPTPSPEPTAAEQLSPAQVYEVVAPSVVVVERLAGSQVTGTGTGVVASQTGAILTALHVVAGGTVRVTFADGTRSAATVEASDPANDIALLAAASLPQVLVPATIGNSGRLAVGDEVVAVGNPLGMTSSATAGVVSGLDRAAAGNDGARLAGLIQFDAAVNPGSSGGPLVNARGETIGIVVALVNPTRAGTFIGIGFAVPIGTALGGGPGSNGPQR